MSENFPSVQWAPITGRNVQVGDLLALADCGPEPFIIGVVRTVEERTGSGATAGHVTYRVRTPGYSVTFRPDEKCLRGTT